ncbi:MAG: hypothetical protein UY71_C0006G0004 [Parcubacteria group bacterium GW2011_GWB1_52_7]|nr:MAG: hypothetical protein UY71_C0006G0004 [Parcubacteria group bacterium GW2011_GWB1_52_7]
MTVKNHILRFRRANLDTFLAIRDREKKIETRAATKKYRKIKAGDKLVFVCGRDRFKRVVRNVNIFRSVGALLRRYKPSDIDPEVKSEKELRARYNSYPKYREKLRRFGVAAFLLQ